MRVMLSITFPTVRFNELWRKGEINEKFQKIMEDIKPEAAYFGMEIDGQRGAVIVVDVASPTDLPRVSEPWYLTFDAEVRSFICMTPEDIGKIDYNGLTEKYA